MVKLVISTGDGSSMWPKGCSSVQEVPNDLLAAFSHASFILKTSENLMEGESPPDWMWAFQEELDVHFERIKEGRKKQFGGSSKTDDDDDGTWKRNELLDDPKWRRK